VAVRPEPSLGSFLLKRGGHPIELPLALLEGLGCLGLHVTDRAFSLRLTRELQSFLRVNLQQLWQTLNSLL